MAEAAEEIESTEETEELGVMGLVFNLEAWVMIPVAVLLDIVGIICLILWLAYGIGGILSYVPDAVGIVIFGIWLLFRYLLVPKEIIPKEKELVEYAVERRMAAKRAVKAVRKTARAVKGGAKGLRFVGAAIGELIPIIGAFPFWTWFVISELKR